MLCNNPKLDLVNINAYIKFGEILPIGSLDIEACIGVLGIQDICHFISRDIGYYPFYFQGCGILGSKFLLLPGMLKIYVIFGTPPPPIQASILSGNEISAKIKGQNSGTNFQK